MTSIRRPGGASVVVLIGLCLIPVAAHLIAPGWSYRAGLDVWNVLELERAYRAASEERADIDEQIERTPVRQAMANQMAATLITDPTLLPSVTDGLIELYQPIEGIRVLLKTQDPTAPSERHRFARLAINRVAIQLAADPVQREAVLARLEIEYRALGAAPESPHAP